MNTRCNLDCEHCHFGRSEDYRTIPRDVRHQIVEEFARLSPGGAVVACGGEPALDVEELLDLGRQCRSLGLRLLTVTNGTHVTPHNAHRWVTEGPTEITISIDSHDPDKHDLWRGAKGSFKAAERAVLELEYAREQVRLSGKPCDTKIMVMTIVGERNYRELPDLFRYVLDRLGADKLKLNMAQPTFAMANGQDAWYEREVVKDVDGLMAIIDDCDRRWNLGIKEEWKKQVAGYFHDVSLDSTRRLGWLSRKGTTEHICNSYDRNIMVGVDLSMKLCFSPTFPSRPWKKPGDLRSFWEGATWRGEMAKCNRYCGISHSVRRQSATGGIA
ncbi:MAG: radical SAM protein [Nitrospira sp.]|nr:radical SAM protein [Nitrospira sp.]